VAALRPRQWFKNLWVLAPVVLTGGLRDGVKTGDAVLAFFCFSAVSSAIYLLNDFLDVEGDRLHPVKRLRPLAAGEIGPAEALLTALLLAILGLGSAVLLIPAPTGSLSVGWVLLAYLSLQLAYNFQLKHMIIVDVMAIAGGFVLRVLAGGVAIDAAISPYLYLSTIFLAVFQGFAKRRHELQILAETAGDHRPSLDDYTIELLDTFLVISATATVMTYCLYAVTTPYRPAYVTVNLLLLTVPFVLYAVFRYLYLVKVRGLGGAPEEILLGDRLFLLDVIAWGLTLVIILYGAS
jgi:4-hydroxybenzoate polyprenyltransferase